MSFFIRVYDYNYMEILIIVAIVVGVFLGLWFSWGIISPHIWEQPEYELKEKEPFHLVFLLSGIVRVSAVILLIPKVTQVRVVTKPILNVKDLSISKWLFDLTLRNHLKKRNKKKIIN